MHTIIDPTALLRGPGATASRAARPDGLTGLRVGLFENTKRNAAELLDALGDLLTAHDGSITLVRRSKGQFGSPMSEELLEDLQTACDVVIVGVGDCGSCSASAVSDGVKLENRGIPTAVVVTEVFEANARAIAELEGSPDFDFMMIPHPVATLTPAELIQEAGEMLPEIVDRVTEPSLTATNA